MLAYNLNCWLQLIHGEEGAEIGSMRHTTLATARLRFFVRGGQDLAACRTGGVRYSDHYQDQGLFHRLMVRVRGIAPGGDGFRRHSHEGAHIDERPCIRFYAAWPKPCGRGG